LLSDSEQGLERFRTEPIQHPLNMPPGKIEIFSQTFSDFGHKGCGSHPFRYEKTDWGGDPLAEK
jgi:biotin/methionine sulfoxide reductase